jgi:nucleoside-diphosphate-sugar epimerase
MRVLVAGASGVIGRQLVPLLTAAGHEAIGLSRSPRSVAGSQWVIVDALDAPALAKAVAQAAPDAVVNLLTAIPSAVNPPWRSPAMGGGLGDQAQHTGHLGCGGGNLGDRGNTLRP